MKSKDLEKQHFKSFAKLSLIERLSWSFKHGDFLWQLMDEKARRLNRELRREGKKYFKA